MVRLKALWQPAFETLVVVSIPHGTIKRNHAHMLFRCSCKVSIPHGTIKSDAINTAIYRQAVSIPHGTIKRRRSSYRRRSSRFQFHMVRLKETCESSSSFERSVSIPQGTIKSIK